MPSTDEIVSQLQGISEDLADKALNALKDAHHKGESKRPESERSLTQARRAIEKAISLLQRVDAAS